MSGDLKAEIGRLRAENKRLDHVTDEQVMLIEHQEAEIERLRAEQDEIVDTLTFLDAENKRLHDALCAIRETMPENQTIERISRRALGGEA